MNSDHDNRLDSWKVIAEYLGRDLRTVQRWEVEKGLPVRRVPGGKRQAVFAFTGEIDEWLRDEAGDLREPPGAGQARESEKSSPQDRAVLLAHQSEESNSPERGGVPPNGGTAAEVREQSGWQVPAAGGELPAGRMARDLPQPFEVEDSLAVAPPRSRRRGVLYSLVGVALVATALLAVWLLMPLAPPRVVSYTEICKLDALWGGIFTDGRQVFFDYGHGEILQVGTGGGESVPVPVPFQGASIWDISPRNSEILIEVPDGIGQQSRLWILPVPAGSPRRVGNVLSSGAAWSPDGQQIVFASGQSLYVTNNEGAQRREILTLPGRLLGPRWSPDGRLLHFVVRDVHADRQALWEAEGDGSHPHPALAGWSGCSEFQWSRAGSWTPDGRYYVFGCGPAGEGALWAMREKSDFPRRVIREPVRLTSGPMSFYSAAVSPDGKKIFAIGRINRAELARYDFRSERFLPYLPGMSADMLDFSRDGSRLTYVAYPERTLWRSKADGSEKLQLTLLPAQVSYPRWSPDGRSIAYCAEKGKRWKIYMVSADGGTPTELIPGDSNQAHPSWSPDGKTLAFAGAPWLENFTPASTAVHLLNLKTREVETLPGSQGLWSPRWSPDGRYIAAVSIDSTKVMLFDVAAKTWTKLATLSVEYTSWSHDGKYLYANLFGSPQGDLTVYRIEIGRRKVERVLNLQGVRLTQTVGWWFGLAPDDSFLFLQDRAVGAVYALDMEWP